MVAPIVERVTMDHLGEYKQFLTHGGYFSPGDKLFELQGENVSRFLHGQLTGDIQSLKIGEASYNLLLTLKGKVVSDLFVYHTKNSFFIAVNPTYAEKVISHFKKYSALSRVTIEDASITYKIFHLCIKSRVENSFVVNRIGLPGFDVILASQSPGFEPSHHHAKMSDELVETIRLEQGIPKIGQDFDETNLPQEARLDRALNYSKGCYLGQEIIARLHFKGHVNKILASLKIAGEKIPSRGTKILNADQEVGMVTSAVFSPKLHAVLAMGTIPYKLFVAGQNLKLENGDSVTVIKPVDL